MTPNPIATSESGVESRQDMGASLRDRAVVNGAASVSAVPASVPSAEDIWTEHLTEPQLAMVIESGAEGFFPGGHGVELIGSGAWRVARSLVAKGLGTIEGGAPQGSSLPGLYFNNAEGARIVGEFDEEDDEE